MSTILQPDRSGLDAVRACVLACKEQGDRCPHCESGPCVVCTGTRRLPTPEPDPRDVWETLATRGLIPASWVYDARRRFLHREEHVSTAASPSRFVTPLPVDRVTSLVLAGDDGPALRATTETLRAHPPTLAAVLALASDVRGVLAAEELAREVAARLDLRPSRVVWRVESEKALRERLTQRAFEWNRVPVYRLALTEDASGWFAQRATHCDFEPIEEHPLYVHRQTRQASAALLALLSTGYVLDSLTPEAVTLVCTEVTA